jgi:hypothetical protein
MPVVVHLRFPVDLSLKCLTRFKSKDNAGHGRVRIWLSFRKSIDTRATWQRTLSCWKTWLKLCLRWKGSTIGAIISFRNVTPYFFFQIQILSFCFLFTLWKIMKYLSKMCKMPRLRQHEKEQAVGMLRAGMAQTQIANHFNVSRMTIYRLMIPPVHKRQRSVLRDEGKDAPTHH